MCSVLCNHFYDSVLLQAAVEKEINMQTFHPHVRPRFGSGQIYFYCQVRNGDKKMQKIIVVNKPAIHESLIIFLNSANEDDCGHLAFPYDN